MSSRVQWLLHFGWLGTSLQSFNWDGELTFESVIHPLELQVPDKERNAFLGHKLTSKFIRPHCVKKKQSTLVSKYEWTLHQYSVGS